jgi:hypothetical protein
MISLSTQVSGEPRPGQVTCDEDASVWDRFAEDVTGHVHWLR